MEDDAYEVAVAPEVEILPPKREISSGEGACSCLCCGRMRSVFDEDGCGICEECLAP